MVCVVRSVVYFLKTVTTIVDEYAVANIYFCTMLLSVESFFLHFAFIVDKMSIKCICMRVWVRESACMCAYHSTKMPLSTR